jgi:hypothetical protein
MAVGLLDGDVDLWTLDGKPRRKQTLENSEEGLAALSVAFSADEDKLVVLYAALFSKKPGKVVVWRLRRGAAGGHCIHWSWWLP